MESTIASNCFEVLRSGEVYIECVISQKIVSNENPAAAVLVFLWDDVRQVRKHHVLVEEDLRFSFVGLEADHPYRVEILTPLHQGSNIIYTLPVVQLHRCWYTSPHSASFTWIRIPSRHSSSPYFREGSHCCVEEIQFLQIELQRVTQDESPPLEVIESSELSFIFTTLKPSTKYEVRCRAKDNHGNWGLFCPLCSFSSKRLLQLHTLMAASDALTVGWSYAGEPSNDVEFVNHLVEVHEGSADGKVIHRFEDVVENIVTVPNLNAGQVYVVELTSFDLAKVPCRSTASLKTLPKECLSPSINRDSTVAHSVRRLHKQIRVSTAFKTQRVSPTQDPIAASDSSLLLTESEVVQKISNEILEEDGESDMFPEVNNCVSFNIVTVGDTKIEIQCIGELHLASARKYWIRVITLHDVTDAVPSLFLEEDSNHLASDTQIAQMEGAAERQMMQKVRNIVLESEQPTIEIRGLTSGGVYAIKVANEYERKQNHWFPFCKHQVVQTSKPARLLFYSVDPTLLKMQLEWKHHDIQEEMLQLRVFRIETNQQVEQSQALLPGNFIHYSPYPFNARLLLSVQVTSGAAYKEWSQPVRLISRCCPIVLGAITHDSFAIRWEGVRVTQSIRTNVIAQRFFLCQTNVSTGQQSYLELDEATLIKGEFVFKEQESARYKVSLLHVCVVNSASVWEEAGRSFWPPMHLNISLARLYTPIIVSIGEEYVGFVGSPSIHKSLLLREGRVLSVKSFSPVEEEALIDEIRSTAKSWRVESRHSESMDRTDSNQDSQMTTTDLKGFLLQLTCFLPSEDPKTELFEVETNVSLASVVSDLLPGASYRLQIKPVQVMLESTEAVSLASSWSCPVEFSTLPRPRIQISSFHSHQLILQMGREGQAFQPMRSSADVFSISLKKVLYGPSETSSSPISTVSSNLLMQHLSLLDASLVDRVERSEKAASRCNWIQENAAALKEKAKTVAREKEDISENVNPLLYFTDVEKDQWNEFGQQLKEAKVAWQDSRVRYSELVTQKLQNAFLFIVPDEGSSQAKCIDIGPESQNAIKLIDVPKGAQYLLQLRSLRPFSTADNADDRMLHSNILFASNISRFVPSIRCLGENYLQICLEHNIDYYNLFRSGGNLSGLGYEFHDAITAPSVLKAAFVKVHDVKTHEEHEIRLEEGIETPFFFQGLEGGKQYALSTCCVDAANGHHCWSDELMVSTIGKLSIGVGDIQETAVDILWQREEDEGNMNSAAFMVCFEITVSGKQQRRVGQSVEEYCHRIERIRVPSSASSTTITQLCPGSWFDITIRAQDINGLWTSSTEVVRIMTQRNLQLSTYSVGERYCVVSIGRDQAPLERGMTMGNRCFRAEEQSLSNVELLVYDESEVVFKVDENAVNGSMQFARSIARNQQSRFEVPKEACTITPLPSTRANHSLSDESDEAPQSVFYVIQGLKTKNLKLYCRAQGCVQQHHYKPWEQKFSASFSSPDTNKESFGSWCGPFLVKLKDDTHCSIRDLSSETATLMLKRQQNYGSAYQLRINGRLFPKLLNFSEFLVLKLLVLNLAMDSLYSLHFREKMVLPPCNSKDKIEDYFDAWYLGLRFRTCPCRPTMPILYECRPNPEVDGQTVISFFWRIESDIDKLDASLFHRAPPNRAAIKASHDEHVVHPLMIHERLEALQLRDVDESLEWRQLQLDAAHLFDFSETPLPAFSETAQIDENETPPPSVCVTQTDSSIGVSEFCVAYLAQLTRHWILALEDSEKQAMKVLRIEGDHFESCLNVPCDNEELVPIASLEQDAQCFRLVEFDNYGSDFIESSNYIFLVECCRVQDCTADHWLPIAEVDTSFIRISLPERVSAYKFRVRSNNNTTTSYFRQYSTMQGKLWSVPSVIVQWKESVAPLSCTWVKIDQISHDSVNVSWMVPRMAYMHNQLHYNIWLKEHNASEWKLASKVRTTTLRLTRLCIATAYDLSVSATSTFGEGPKTKATTFQTQNTVQKVTHSFSDVKAVPSLVSDEAVQEETRFGPIIQNRDWQEYFLCDQNIDFVPPFIPMTGYHLFNHLSRTDKKATFPVPLFQPEGESEKKKTFLVPRKPRSTVAGISRNLKFEKPPPVFNLKWRMMRQRRNESEKLLDRRSRVIDIPEDWE